MKLQDLLKKAVDQLNKAVPWITHLKERTDLNNKLISEVNNDMKEMTKVVDETGNKLNDLISTVNELATGKGLTQGDRDTIADLNMRIGTISGDVDKNRKGINAMIKLLKLKR